MAKADIEKLLEAAVSAGMEAGLKELDRKLDTAIKAGIEVGAKIGAEIGAASAAKAVAKAAERERKRIRQEHADWRLHNTRLLVMNYRTLNEHYRNAVYDTETAEEHEDFKDIMMRMHYDIVDEDLKIESILKSSIRTKIIMTHVNWALDCYETLCEKRDIPEETRRYRILKYLYIDDEPLTVKEIAEAEGVSVQNIYYIIRNLGRVTEELNILLFGIDAIEEEIRRDAKQSKKDPM